MAELTKIYEEGEKALRAREFGVLLDGVETGFVLAHNREVLDRYQFRQQCIDGVDPDTGCRVLGLELRTPVIMSAMTMPIPAIIEEGLMEVALGLKAAGSLMWTGTPIPQNLEDIAATGVPLAANVKPFRDRNKMSQVIGEILDSGVQWLGVEIDSGQGTKIGDRQMASDCAPLTFTELEELRRKTSLPDIQGRAEPDGRSQIHRSGSGRDRGVQPRRPHPGLPSPSLSGHGRDHGSRRRKSRGHGRRWVQTGERCLKRAGLRGIAGGIGPTHPFRSSGGRQRWGYGRHRKHHGGAQADHESRGCR